MRQKSSVSLKVGFSITNIPNQTPSKEEIRIEYTQIQKRKRIIMASLSQLRKAFNDADDEDTGYISRDALSG